MNIHKMMRIFDKSIKYLLLPGYFQPTGTHSLINLINKRAKTFNVKVEASCRGRGIFLTRNYKHLDKNEHYVVQMYLHKPYPIDDLKFYLRIYLVLCCVNPMRAFIYKEGMVRFATEPYWSPAPSNIKNMCVHLTNYAINKNHEDYEAE